MKPLSLTFFNQKNARNVGDVALHEMLLVYQCALRVFRFIIVHMGIKVDS
jgi:hypothetical protein